MHIMEFSNNFYLAVKNKATGEGRSSCWLIGTLASSAPSRRA